MGMNLLNMDFSNMSLSETCTQEIKDVLKQGKPSYFAPLSDNLVFFYMDEKKMINPLTVGLLDINILKFDELWWFRDQLLSWYNTAESAEEFTLSDLRIHYNELGRLDGDWRSCDNDESVLKLLIKNFCQAWYKATNPKK